MRDEFVALASVGCAAELRTDWLYVSWAISFICVPEGPHGSLDVASRTFACTSEYPVDPDQPLSRALLD
jgi:hypothetical protein